MIEDLAVRLAAIERLAKAAYRAPAAGAEASIAYVAAKEIFAEISQRLDVLIRMGGTGPIPQHVVMDIRGRQKDQMRNLEALAGFRGPQDQRSRRAVLAEFVSSLNHTRDDLRINVEESTGETENV